MIEDSLAHKAKKQLYKAAKEIDMDPNLLKEFLRCIGLEEYFRNQLLGSQFFSF